MDGRGKGKGKGKGAAGKGGKGGRGGKGGGSSGTPSPALLTANLKNARAVDELFRHVSAHSRLFNQIHLSACWSSLGRLAWEASDREAWVEVHAASLDTLVQRTAAVVSEDDVRVRELANVAHGIAKSGCGAKTGALLGALAIAIERRLSDCNAQECSNIA